MFTAIPKASWGLSDHIAYLECVVLAGTGDEMQRDYWYSSSRDWRELESAEAIGRESARRTIARLGPRRIRTRRAPVLFVPEIAARTDRTFRGRDPRSSQYRQSSFLLNCAVNPCFRRDSRLPSAAYSESVGQRALR